MNSGKHPQVTNGLQNPLPTDLDMGGNDIILDADGNSRLELGTDNTVELFLNALSKYKWDVNDFTMGGQQILFTNFRIKTGAGGCLIRNTADTDNAPLEASAITTRGGGSEVFILASTGDMSVVSGCDIMWSSTGNATGAKDVGLARNAAGVLRVSNGSTGIGAVTEAVPVSVRTGAYTMLVTDSGTLFTNEGTTARVDITLPGAAAGLRVRAYCQDTDGIRFIAAAGDTIRINTTVSTSGGTCTSTAVGSFVELIAINATEWVASSSVGTWTLA